MQLCVFCRGEVETKRRLYPNETTELTSYMLHPHAPGTLEGSSKSMFPLASTGFGWKLDNHKFIW